MYSKKSWWILIIVALGVIIPFMIPYLTFDPAGSRVAIISTTIQYPVLVAHIIFAFIALITGFLQFFEGIRQKHPKVHRYFGRIYIGSAFISGLLSFGVVFYVEDFTKAVSFLVLAFLWLFTGWKGYRSAVKRKFKDHQIWMIRSFAITLVAVTGRIVVPFLLLAYYTFHGFTLTAGREQMVAEVLNVNIWVGIVLNIVIVEWVIRKK